MNHNIKRHKLLEILSTQELNCQTRKHGYNIIGVGYDEIYRKLNVDEFKLLIITSELYQNNEISYHNTGGVEGLCIDHSGLSAFSNEKYLKKNHIEIIDHLKNFVQIVIPILALTVAILSFTSKFNNLKMQSAKELREVKILLLEQQNHLKKLELKINKNNQVEKKK